MMMSNSAKNPSRAVQFAVLTVGIFAISSGSILIRLAQNESVPSLVIAFWRMMLSTLMLLPFTLAGRRQELGEMGREKWGLAVLSGMLLGLHFATWTSSLAFTSITSSTVLVATAPLWVGLASPFLLNEPLSRGLKQGIGLAIMGTVVVSMGAVVGLENGRVALNLAGSADGNQALLGNALALIGGIAVAGYMIIGRRLRPHLSLLSYTTVVYGMSAITLLLINLVGGYPTGGLQRDRICLVYHDGPDSAVPWALVIQLGIGFLTGGLCVAGGIERTCGSHCPGHFYLSRVSRAYCDRRQHFDPERRLPGQSRPGVVQANLLVALPRMFAEGTGPNVRLSVLEAGLSPRRIKRPSCSTEATRLIMVTSVRSGL